MHVNVQPACPRCGYDLQGQVATWHPQGGDAEGACCPCAGTCSECGLTVEWRLVMRPELAAVPWFVETVALRRWRYTSVPTWIMAFVPWMFWSRVRLEAPRRPMPRLWWMLVWWIVVPATGLLITAMSISAINTYKTTAGWVWNGTAWIPPPPKVVTFVDVLAAWEVQAGLMLQQPLETLYGLAQEFLRRPAMTGLAITLAGFPLMMLALPFSRAQSKVQMGHVWRSAAYAIAPFALAAMLPGATWFVAACFAAASKPSPMWLTNASNWTYRFVIDARASDLSWIFMGMGAWFLVWWGCAFKIGFRMKDWWAVLPATFVPVAIAAVLGSALLRMTA